jgi:hypothetical protein
MDNKIQDNFNLKEEDKIQQILLQTNYTREEIINKLEQYDGDVISVIREYMGIKPKISQNKINSKHVNQEIYRQIRRTLDDGMRQYREKNPINIEQVANNLRESEERKNKNKK